MPPFDRGAGSAWPLIVAQVLSSRRYLAVQERGTYVFDPTVQNFMRPAKALRDYGIRSLRAADQHPGLADALDSLQVIGSCRTNVPDIGAKPYHWCNDLTPYARWTDLRSPPAMFARNGPRRTTNPAQLFFDRLRDACATFSVAKPGVTIVAELVATTLDCDLMGLDRAIGLFRHRRSSPY